MLNNGAKPSSCLLDQRTALVSSSRNSMILDDRLYALQPLLVHTYLWLKMVLQRDVPSNLGGNRDWRDFSQTFGVEMFRSISILYAWYYPELVDIPGYYWVYYHPIISQ